jgi:hypothetical protein
MQIMVSGYVRITDANGYYLLAFLLLLTGSATSKEWHHGGRKNVVSNITLKRLDQPLLKKKKY